MYTTYMTRREIHNVNGIMFSFNETRLPVQFTYEWTHFQSGAKGKTTISVMNRREGLCLCEIWNDKGAASPNHTWTYKPV